jgi:hypothetical protein
MTALDQLIASHDATHREFARAISRGDKNGAAAANRDLINIGEQIDMSAHNTIAAIDQQLAQVQAMNPELRHRTRLLQAQAAQLGRLTHDHSDNSVRQTELETVVSSSQSAMSVSHAALIIFITCALAFITGYYRVILSCGIIMLMIFYKPFSTSVRWQSLINAVQ